VNRFDLKVTVVYEWRVEANTWEDANEMGFTYQDYPNLAIVESIDCTELGDHDE
jgi:hypothetical protein